MAVEKGFRILEHRLIDFPCLLRPPGDAASRESNDGGSIVWFMMTVLCTHGRNQSLESSDGRRLSLAEHLMRRAILSILARVLQRALDAKLCSSIQGTLLERMVTTTLDLVARVAQGRWISALGAFRLLALPSLSSFCPSLIPQAQPILLHFLPFIEQILSIQNPAAVATRIDMATGDFNQSCLTVFVNLLDLLPKSLSRRLENSPAQLRSLAVWMSRFMIWVIQQDLHVVEHDDENEMASDEWLSASQHVFPRFRPSVHLQGAVEKLHGSQDQFLIRSLTEALFSDGELDGQTASSFCELLYFMICTAKNANQLNGMILSFALSARLIERLWRQCIQRSWTVSRLAFPEPPLVDSLLAPILVICQIYSAFLSVATKEDITQQQIPLTLQEIYDPMCPEKGLITVLKKCMWCVGWIRTPGPSTTDSHTLHSTMMSQFPRICGRLLVQLHDNLTRWDLVPSEHFQIQSAQLSQFVKEASSQPIHPDEDEEMPAGNHRAPVLLNHASCLIPFRDRARIFQSHIDADKKRFQSANMGFSAPPVHANVRRLLLLEDGFEALGNLKGADLKGRLRVEFVDEHGMVEAGVDGGGLFKDFIEELAKKGFDSDYGFFAATEQQELYPNPSAVVLQPRALQIINFLGRMMGTVICCHIRRLTKAVHREGGVRWHSSGAALCTFLSEEVPRTVV